MPSSRPVMFREIPIVRVNKFPRGHVRKRVVSEENTGRISEIQSSLESLDCVI